MSTMRFVLAAALVLMAGSAAGQSTVVNGVTYSLVSIGAKFNTLATTTTGCPSGYVFSGFTGDDVTAAVMLASNFHIWVNANTLSGKVPAKASGATVISYEDNSAELARAYICKSTSGGSVPAPVPVPVPVPVPAPSYGGSYTLFTGTVFVQDAYTGCSSRGLVLASWANAADKAAIQSFLSSTVTKIFTSDATVGGMCPVATASGLVMDTCNQNIAYVCATSSSGGGSTTPSYGGGGSTPSNLPAGYSLQSTFISSFQGCFSTCQALGMRFVPYLQNGARALDVTAVNAALSTVSTVYVNDYTVAGQCPIVSSTSMGVRTLASCNSNLPFLCGPL